MSPADNGSDDYPAPVSLEVPLQIDLASLCSIARQTRQQMNSDMVARVFECDVRQPLMDGPNNLVYTLVFSDGVKWIARFPKAPVWNSFQQHRMELDLFTLDFLEEKYIHSYPPCSCLLLLSEQPFVQAIHSDVFS